jgi:hypothetical protein
VSGKRRASRVSSHKGQRARVRAKTALRYILPASCIAVIAAAVCLAVVSARQSVQPGVSAAMPGLYPAPKVVRAAESLDQLLAMTAEQLAYVDIAEMNLLCASGLPGAENLDIDHALATLDRWADRVAFETDRHLYRAHDPKWADHYRHSEAYLRAEMLVQVLCEDLGVKYNLAVKDSFDFADSRVAFIHGMIPMPGQTLADTPGGTCASMPVMVTAVGRRLGYPLKLVGTKGHLFVRWDGENHANPTWRERFNMEVTHGFSSFEDDYYKTWPFKLTEREVRLNRHLVSMSAAEEFAEFLAARGHCGLDNGQIAFAARSYENAYRYDTARPAYRAWFLDAAGKSGYEPDTPVLAQALARRMRPAVARRDPMAMRMPTEMAAAAAGYDLLGVSPMRIGQWQQRQPIMPAIPQAPYGPRPPQAGIPQPGIPNPYRPYQPPVPGRPPG